jgi:hypothetical protein
LPEAAHGHQLMTSRAELEFRVMLPEPWRWTDRSVSMASELPHLDYRDLARLVSRTVGIGKSAETRWQGHASRAA